MAEQPTATRPPARISRRRVLALTGSAGVVALTAATESPALSAVLPPLSERTLSFHNLHTGERLTAPYWVHGHPHREGLAKIDHILRDWRTGEVKTIDRELFDLLHALRRRLGTEAPFEVISGYRSPETNAMLRKVSTGVAKRSYHVKGMAIDIRVPDRDLKTLHSTALAMRAGGVGYYPEPGFVHVDVGPVRRW